MDDQPSTVKPDSPPTDPPLTPGTSSSRQTPVFVSQADQVGSSVKHSKRKFLVPLVLAVLCLVVISGFYVYSKHKNNTNTTNTYGKLYKTTNASLFLLYDTDTAPPGEQTYLKVAFGDSSDLAGCGSVNPNFQGHITISYANANSAQVTITQNVNPNAPEPGASQEWENCDADLGSPEYITYAEISSNWANSGNPTKSFVINGHNFTLTQNSADYSLTLADSTTNQSVLRRIPADITEIGASDSSQQCTMTTAQLDSYLQSQNIELADDKYSDITQKLATLYPSDTNEGTYALVINSKNVDTLTVTPTTTKVQGCWIERVPTPYWSEGGAANL
jgi:hypothetical protein